MTAQYTDLHNGSRKATVYYWLDPDTGAALYHTGVNDEATILFFPDVGATGYNETPEPDRLGRQAVEHRANQFIEDDEAEEYWDGEEDAVRELMAARDVEA